MKPIDYLKGAGAGLLLAAADMALAFLVVTVYGRLFEPGHDQAYYGALALKIAPWSTHLLGPLLFVGAAWLFGRRRPGRNPYAFAIVFTLAYTLLEGASIVAMGQLDAFIKAGDLGWLTLKFVAAAIGSHLAAVRRPTKASLA